MNPDATLAIGLFVCVALLLVHAVATHGPWFAAIWLVLTGTVGSLLFVIGRGGLPWAAVPYPPVVMYLGALLAKGAVERSAWRGSVAPFVVACGVLSGVIAWPIEYVALATGCWTTSGAVGGAIELAASGLTFALAYRLASRVTQNDRRKFALLALALPGIAAAPLAFAWLAR